MRWCAVAIASYRWMSTCRAARRRRKRWCTASCSCRKRSRAPARSPDSANGRVRKGSELIEALARKVDAQLQGRARRVSARTQELSYETDPAEILSVCRTLRDAPELKFQMLMDLAGLDYLHYGCDDWQTSSATRSGFSRARVASGAPPAADEPGRFAVVYNLLSIEHNQRLRLRVRA